jgi:hypothetical protein
MKTEFLDFDFRQVDAGLRGHLASPRFCGRGDFEAFADNFPTIPETDWERLIREMDQGPTLEHLITRIYDQGQTVSCTSNATCQAHEIKQAEAYGLDAVTHLAAMSVYREVGSRNSGSSEWDNLQQLCKIGALPLPDQAGGFAHTHPANDYDYRRPAGWEQTAARFRALEWYELGNVNEFISALLLRFPVVYGRDGHAICGVRPVINAGAVVVKYVNSWGDWGDSGGSFNSGFGYDSLRKIRNAADSAWALRAIHAPTNPLTP